MPLMDATENPRFQQFMTMADKFRTMGVRTNADTPDDAKLSFKFWC
jgi:pyruvate, orthophosphate dikinase